MADTDEDFGNPESFLADPNIRFPRLPKLVSDLGVYPMPDGIGVQFRGGPTAVVFRGARAGPIFEFLLAVLDGTQDIKTILTNRPAALEQADVVHTLALLHSKGLLCDGARGPRLAEQATADEADGVLRRQLQFWGRNLGVSGFNGSAAQSQHKLKSSKIVLIATGLFGAATYDLLQRSGCENIDVIAWDDSGEVLGFIAKRHHLETTAIEGMAEALRQQIPAAEIVVVAARNAPDPLLRVINRIALESCCPVLFANDAAGEYNIGPCVLPFASACYRCLERRKASAHENMLEEHLYARELSRPRPAGLTLPVGEATAAATLAAGFVATEVIRIVTAMAPGLYVNAQLEISALTGDMANHSIMRTPRCPDCSTPSTLPVADHALDLQHL